MSLYKRGGNWHYLFYVNGNRYRKSTDIKIAGRRNQQEAEKVMARAITAAEAGELVKPKKAPVLRDYLKDFVEFVNAMNKAPKTRTDYLSGSRLSLATDLAGMRMDRITAGDIQATKFHDSPYSTNSALRTLRRAFNRALEKELVRKIPKIKLVHAPRRESMISIEDEMRLLTAIRHSDENRRYKKSEPAPLHDILTVMLDTGMRPSEVLRMRREVMHLNEFYYFNPKGKTRKSRRRVPLSNRVIPILRTRMQGDQTEGWLFPSRKSKSGHFELGALQRKFRSIARSLNIANDLKLYCARHTFGTVVMEESKDPSLVRDTMGHEDLKTTMEYMHPDLGRIKSIIDRRNEQKFVM
jgi:integrase